MQLFNLLRRITIYVVWRLSYQNSIFLFDNSVWIKTKALRSALEIAYLRGYTLLSFNFFSNFLYSILDVYLPIYSHWHSYKRYCLDVWMVLAVEKTLEIDRTSTAFLEMLIDRSLGDTLPLSSLKLTISKSVSVFKAFKQFYLIKLSTFPFTP